MKKIPDGWHEVTIEEIASVDSGQGAPQGDKWYNGEKIFIKAGDLNNLTEGKYVGDYCQRISNEAISHHNLKEYPANSIVFPKSGMSVKTDNIALLKYDSYVVNHLAIVKVNEDLCSEKYLYYLFKGKKISNLSLNDSYPSIRLQDIKNFKALLPPLPTQIKIAAVLEKAEKLREWRKEADGLTDKFLKSTFLEMFGDPEKNPNKWETRTFKDIIQEFRYGSSNKSSGDGYPILRIPNIIGGKINLIDLKYCKVTDEEYEKLKLIYGDILFVRTNGNQDYVGRSAIVDKSNENYIYASYLIRARINKKIIIPEYLKQYLFTTSIKKVIKSKTNTSAGQYNINTIGLGSVEILIPPLSLQQKFASIVQQVEQVCQYQNESKQQIDHFFNVLMQKAFNGELEA